MFVAEYCESTCDRTLGPVIKYAHNTLKYVDCNFSVSRQWCGCAVLLLCF